MVRLLLSLGADANKVCSRGICPLMLTAANLSEPGYEEIKEALLQAGARSDENLLSAAETFVW
jgi:ankyrin repeat protein